VTWPRLYRQGLQVLPVRAVQQLPLAGLVRAGQPLLQAGEFLLGLYPISAALPAGVRAAAVAGAAGRGAALRCARWSRF
jgi:hypothetical protein